MKKNGVISFCKLTLLLVGLFPPTVKEKKSNDFEDSDKHAQVCLIRVRAKLCRNGPDLRIPGICSRAGFLKSCPAGPMC